MVDFNLTKGMSNYDLIRELKGRVAGESRDQVQVYLSVPPMVEDQVDDDARTISTSRRALHTLTDLQINKRAIEFAKKVASGLHSCPHLQSDIQKRAEAITHIVLAVDHVNKYALIEKKQYHYEQCASCKQQHVLKEGNGERSTGFRDFTRNPPEYLLAGINDDDKLYFLHPLNRIPPRLIKQAIQEGEVQGIVDWANRKDEGFNMRIQGDIIAKNLNVTRFATHEEHVTFVSNVITGNVGQTLAAFVNDLTFDKAQCYYCQTQGGVLQVHDAIVTRLDNVSDSGRGRNSDTVDEVSTLSNSRKESHFIDINNIKNNKLSSISIGNRHKLVTDGHIERISRNGMRNVFCIVEASQVILEHPEHAKVEHKIGNGDAATASMLITIQRGSVNNGLDD